MLAINQLVTARAATHNLRHMDNSRLVTRVNKQVTTSSRVTSSRQLNNKLHLPTLLKLLVLMVSLQPVSTTHKVDHLVTTSPAITVRFMLCFNSIYKMELKNNLVWLCAHPTWCDLMFVLFLHR